MGITEHRQPIGPELGRYAQGLDATQFADFTSRLLTQLNAGKSLDDAFDAAK